MIQPLGERHLAVGQAEAIFVRGHGVGAFLDVAPHDVEVTLRRTDSQVILTLQRSKSQQ
jgi:hypothetical protein